MGNLASGGLHLLSREILNYIGSPPSDLARDVFPRIVTDATAPPLIAWRIAGYHLDIGTWETYRRAVADVARGLFP
jgi:NDP-sugar pyrophosphorylase family protein